MKLSTQAVQDIAATFNSMTGEYLTVAEYTERFFPGAEEWPGDACGCIDDRCIGYHHDASDPCQCRDTQLNEFHDELAEAWQEQRAKAAQ